MKEILEVEESGEKQSAQEPANIFFKDPHLVTFEKESYPSIEDGGEDGDHSPRIANSLWNKYETKSEDATGATSSRHDANLLDNMIQVLQTTTSELRNGSKRQTV